MKTCLLGIPVKGQMPVWAVRNLIDIGRTRFQDWTVSIRFLEGAPVQQARNELVQNARNEKVDAIVFCDVDLSMGPKELARLLSHEEEVICALYCHRTISPTLWHVTPTNPPSPERADGLMRVKQCAIGASRIMLSVFDRLQKDNPDRSGVITARDGGSKLIHDFFAFELVGLNTPESRLKSIASMVQCSGSTSNEEIRRILETTYLADNLHTSEDYGFCRLLEKSGIPLFLDTKLICQHATEAMVPLPTQQLMDMMAESWRQEEISQLNGSNN